MRARSSVLDEEDSEEDMGRISVGRLSADFGFQANLDGKGTAVVNIGRPELSHGIDAFSN